MRLFYQAAFALTTLLGLAGCSRPAQHDIDTCRQTAIRQGVGHQLNDDDIGELTESCMASKGFALKENGEHCSENLATAINRGCYYRNNFFGRMSTLAW